MTALYGTGQAIIFFCHVISSSSSIFFFSSPNLSHHRLDVYHTSAYGVALDAGVKLAACGSLKIQDTKNCQKFAIWALWHKFDGLYLRN